MVRVPNLQTNSPASCKGCYAAICLPSEEVYMGESCHVSGWGWTNPDDDNSLAPILKEAGVSIMNHDYCKSCTDRTQPFEVIESLEFCAGNLDRDGDGLIDAGDNQCNGDSGGPITCVRNGQPELAGVVSWKTGKCGKVDGMKSVYVNVRAYLQWIKQVIDRNGDQRHFEGTFTKL